MARTNPAPMHLHYSSVAELRHAATSACAMPSHTAQIAGYLTAVKGKGWHGMDGGAEAVLRALTDGYPEGEAMIRVFHDSIAASLPRAEGHHRTRVRGPMGDELDVHTMMRGSFDRAWSSSVRKVRRGSGVLRLVVDIGANASTDATAMAWRGIAGLSLAETMQRAGYSVEIVAAFAVQAMHDNSTANRRMMMTCVVKPRSSQMDYGLLASTVALPGFFRSLGFACIVLACDQQLVHASDTLGRYLDVSGVLPVPDKVMQLMIPQSIHDERSAVEFVQQSVKLLQG